MEEERIATIIKEINYWKSHKLLPEMYCDYLLALYSNGEVVSEPSTAKEKSRFKPSFLVQFVIQLLLVPFSFLVIYFTEFHPILQLCILILFMGSSFWQYYYYKKEDKPLSHLSLVVFLLLLLLTTVFLSNLYVHHQGLTNALIIAQFFGWLLLGLKNQLKYINIASVVGIVLTVLIIVL
ncbi:hypothetical protein [Lentibacillus sp. Marseille-P4043]|uniref:hypothetical protein n=1 Tax=Lentibacillus sp. Marseille-P4043 TaxID=2040293 RepID=UPI000D0B7392|nr:hypothetical protein [Lentibacillus sp. Marseille-P4043]